MQIDLNCDMGESYGHWSVGADEALMPLVSSINVACGFHAGDPATMRRTLRLARSNAVAAGAHPGYPDLQGFGRRNMALSPAEVRDAVLYQLGALAGFAAAEGIALTHVKAHGALYNAAAANEPLAEAVASAVASFSRELILVGLAGSLLIEAGRAAGLAIASEAFADRTYEADGSLRDRRLPGALFTSPEDALAQALSIARDGVAFTYDGQTVPVRADTICIHGDTPGALTFATHIRKGLAAAGIDVKPLKHAERMQ